MSVVTENKRLQELCDAQEAEIKFLSQDVAAAAQFYRKFSAETSHLSERVTYWQQEANKRRLIEIECEALRTENKALNERVEGWYRQAKYYEQRANTERRANTEIKKEIEKKNEIILHLQLSSPSLGDDPYWQSVTGETSKGAHHD